ncbi:MAG: hypothetical protein N7Q72_04385, partial [Spiroplasma sp. Tabriz.8]|nr:hypothetical protein [Spiroplasma sp. Tabriz.8]
ESFDSHNCTAWFVLIQFFNLIHFLITNNFYNPTLNFFFIYLYIYIYIYIYIYYFYLYHINIVYFYYLLVWYFIFSS